MHNHAHNTNEIHHRWNSPQQINGFRLNPDSCKLFGRECVSHGKKTPKWTMSAQASWTASREERAKGKSRRGNSNVGNYTVAAALYRGKACKDWLGVAGADRESNLYRGRACQNPEASPGPVARSHLCKGKAYRNWETSPGKVARSQMGNQHGELLSQCSGRQEAGHTYKWKTHAWFSTCVFSSMCWNYPCFNKLLRYVFSLCRSWHLWRRTSKRRVHRLQILQAPVPRCISACIKRCHDTVFLEKHLLP